MSDDFSGGGGDTTGGGDVNWGSGWGTSDPATPSGSGESGGGFFAGLFGGDKSSTASVPAPGNETFIYIDNSTPTSAGSRMSGGSGRVSTGFGASSTPRPWLRAMKTLAKITVGTGAGYLAYKGFEYGVADLARAVTPLGNMHYAVAGGYEVLGAAATIYGVGALAKTLVRPAVAGQSAPTAGAR